MANVNTNNMGYVTGRLTKDPVAFRNSDGSLKVYVDVAAAHNYTDDDGKRGAEFVSLQGFVRAERQGNPGVYGIIKKGSLVTISYDVRNNNYTDKNGQAVYSQVLNITGVQILESKATTDARAAAHAAAEAAVNMPVTAPVQVPVAAPAVAQVAPIQTVAPAPAQAPVALGYSEVQSQIVTNGFPQTI